MVSVDHPEPVSAPAASASVRASTASTEPSPSNPDWQAEDPADLTCERDGTAHLTCRIEQASFLAEPFRLGQRGCNRPRSLLVWGDSRITTRSELACRACADLACDTQLFKGMAGCLPASERVWRTIPRYWEKWRTEKYWLHATNFTASSCERMHCEWATLGPA